MSDTIAPSVAPPESSAPASPTWYRQPIAWFWHMQDSGSRSKLYVRSLWALVLLVGGFAVNEAYSAMRTYFVDPDAYLKKIEEKQDASFKSLQDSLSRLSSSLDSGDRSALQDVRSAASEIRSVNQSLLQQLALAKRENERLSDVAGQQGRALGGYDFMLGEDTGIALDAGTAIGVSHLSSSYAVVNVSAVGRSERKSLTSGESIRYSNAQGQSCAVTLLSIHGGAASFKAHCA